MDYINMIKDAKSKGLTNESKMWASVEEIGKELDCIKEIHPDFYWSIMRKQHEIMFNKHYSEEFAEHDVSNLSYTDVNGVEKRGAHWTKQQIVDATSSLQFPNSVNDCDKYVAFNATYADLCIELDDDAIISVAYRFWFKDKDWTANGSETKIWDYMCLHAKLNAATMK